MGDDDKDENNNYMTVRRSRTAAGFISEPGEGGHRLSLPIKLCHYSRLIVLNFVFYPPHPSPHSPCGKVCTYIPNVGR